MVMRETLDEFQGGLQIGGWMIMNLRYADEIIPLATSGAELQELVDRLDWASRKYSLLINVDNGTACRKLIQNEQMNTFPYLESLFTEDGECIMEFRTRLNRGQAIGASLQKIWKSHSLSISTKIQLMKVLVWPVASYGRESWTLRKKWRNMSWRLEMKGLRKILRVSPRAEKTNEWVLNKSWSKEGTVRQRQSKEASILRKQGSCLEKEIMQGTMPGVCRQGRPCTAWMDNIKTWTGLSVEESIRMTEDRDKWRKYVHGVATLISRTAKEKNRTALNIQWNMQQPILNSHKS